MPLKPDQNLQASSSNPNTHIFPAPNDKKFFSRTGTWLLQTYLINGGRLLHA